MNAAARPVSPNTTQTAATQPALRKLAGAVALICAMGAGAAFADTLPTGGSVAQGSATITTPTGSSMQVNVATSKAVINWNGFSIANGYSVQFVQPGASSVVLNRVTGVNPSSIDGNLSANGQVFLVNPNGVYFGPTAHVDVGGLVASTLDIADSDFASGNYAFAKVNGSPLGQVFNSGTINAPGGNVALLGEQVINGASGVINAQQGSITLAAGEHVSVTLGSNQLLSFAVDQRALNNLAYVQNGGQLLADGGSVSMQAMVANAVSSAVVNQSGLIRAAGVADKNGEVYLTADGGNLEVSGSVQVGALSGAPASTLSLSATGGNITVTGTGSLNASGASATNLYAVADGSVSLNGSISASSTEGAANIGIQGTSVALNGANISNSAFFTSSTNIVATTGGITQGAGGVINGATTASAQEASDAGGFTFAGVSLSSTGAQNLAGSISTVSHGPQAGAAVSAVSANDAVSVNQITSQVDGGGTNANISLQGAGNVSTTGNLLASADAGPATANITSGGAVQLGGNLTVQGASSPSSATLATVNATGGDITMAPGTRIAVTDNAGGASAGAGLGITASAGQVTLGDISVISAHGPAQTQIVGANGVTFTGNSLTSGASAYTNISASNGSTVAVDAGKSVQSIASSGGALLNISTPAGTLQIDGTLSAQGPNGNWRVSTDPASPWDAAGVAPQLALDSSQDILSRLLIEARTTPASPFAGNGLVVSPNWSILGMSPLNTGNIDAALYEDDGQDSIIPTSEIKGDGAPINAAMSTGVSRRR
ncbi:MAG TPA: filamentous hemagglutinin N-terminal domain-containing protein [Burkholderiales bacterium]|jgi:filamentous hemagglutinin family protein